MTKFFLCLPVCIFFGQLSAQKKQHPFKLYAYEQKVYSGVNNQIATIDSSIIMPASSGSSMQYFIYTERMVPQSQLKITRIWVKQKLYSVKMDAVLPPIVVEKQVVVEGSNRADTLVPVTKNKVWYLGLITGDIRTENSSVYLKTKIASNEVVIEYYLGKSTARYACLKKIKQLPRAAMQ